MSRCSTPAHTPRFPLNPHLPIEIAALNPKKRLETLMKHLQATPEFPGRGEKLAANVPARYLRSEVHPSPASAVMRLRVPGRDHQGSPQKQPLRQAEQLLAANAFPVNDYKRASSRDNSCRSSSMQTTPSRGQHRYALSARYCGCVTPQKATGGEPYGRTRAMIAPRPARSQSASDAGPRECTSLQRLSDAARSGFSPCSRSRLPQRTPRSQAIDNRYGWSHACAQRIRRPRGARLPINGKTAAACGSR